MCYLYVDFKNDFANATVCYNAICLNITSPGKDSIKYLYQRKQYFQKFPTFVKVLLLLKALISSVADIRTIAFALVPLLFSFFFIVLNIW